jgi:predicted metal-dependent peptidase
MQETILKLLILKPFYGYVAASITPIEDEGVKTIKMAIIPSLKLLYNPTWFRVLRAEQKIGVVIHELSHLILWHPYRRGNRDTLLWSIACDMAVNEQVDKEQLPEDSITVELISNTYKLKLDKQKAAEYYYNKIIENDEILAFIGNDDEILIQINSDLTLKANKLSEENLSEADKNAVMNDLSQIMEDAAAEGEVPAVLQNAVDEVYEEFKVNWRKMLKRFITGRGKIQTRKSYKRQSRRFEDLPGTKRAIGVDALVAIDESGSITNSLVNSFFKELQSINKITGASIKVTRFDTECTEPVSIKDYVKNNERLKNGGTDFRPVFELADKMKTSLLIIFTDGDGEAPLSANQKTLWVLTKGGKKPAQFGYYVTFDE